MALALPPLLSVPDLLAAKGCGDLLSRVANVLRGILRRDRPVFPIGQDVDCQEVGSGRKLWRSQPELPYIRIGNRKLRPPLNLLKIRLDPSGRKLAPEQDLITDDQSFNRG